LPSVDAKPAVWSALDPSSSITEIPLNGSRTAGFGGYVLPAKHLQRQQALSANKKTVTPGNGN
jgi:hypothetical protein